MSGFMVRHVSLGTVKKASHARRKRAPKVRLKVAAFDKAMEILDCETEVAKAELLKMTDRTVRRAKLGKVGEDFIASTLTAFTEPERALKLKRRGLKPVFDSFFEVVA